jgi:ubiquinone/menaquinone biosynthesis C-methylase UbiE
MNSKPGGSVGSSAKLSQRERWEGADGDFWIRHYERHLVWLGRLTPYLLDAAKIRPGERVLDIGCGCGATTIAAWRAARRDGASSRGRAVGIDLSYKMLNTARQLAAREDAENVGFVQGDAQICPVRTHSFDVVISSFGVMFFKDPDAAFSNIAAALNDRGRLAFLCWQPDSCNDSISIPLRVFADHMQRPPAVDQFVDRQYVEELLFRTGWKDIRIEPVIDEMAWMASDVDDMMNYVWTIPTYQTMQAGLSNETLTEVRTAIAEQYAARQQSDGIRVRAAAWLVTASRV